MKPLIAKFVTGFVFASLVIACSQHPSEEIKAAGAEFTVNTSAVLVSDFVGNGTQYNQNLYSTISEVDGITQANVGDLETKVKQLKSQHVRIFFDSRAFDAASYPDYMDSFIRTVELAQASGATINITYWHGPYTNISEQMSDFANVLQNLIVIRGLHEVQYVTIQNEVNSTAITQTTYQQLYRELDKRLTDQGIRGSVKLIGGDLVRTNQASWFDYMAANMNDILDGYSIHIYWNYWDQAYAITRLSEVRAIVDAMAPATQKPVYITEYGIRGEKTLCLENPGCLTGTSTPIGSTIINALQHAWFQIKAMNYKYVACVKWDAYKAKYDNGSQYYSVIGSAADGYPIMPLYNVIQMFTYTLNPGWQIVEVIQGPVQTKLVSALKNPVTGDITVYILNDTGTTTTFSISGLPSNKQFHLMVWNEEADGGIRNGGIVKTNASGVVTITLNLESFATLTTVDPAPLGS